MELPIKFNCMLILERDVLYSRWKMGIERSLEWETLPETNGNYRILIVSSPFYERLIIRDGIQNFFFAILCSVRYRKCT